jgi:hypothetical protein
MNGRRIEFRGLAFDGFPRFFPADDTGGEMFDIGVPEFAGEVSGFSVGPAVFVATVGDDECGFFFREEFRDFGFSGDEVDGSGDVAGSEGVSAVHIDERNLALGDGSLEFVEGDVGVFFCGEEGEGEDTEGGDSLATVHRLTCCARCD